jgi:hypothetical protein
MQIERCVSSEPPCFICMSVEQSHNSLGVCDPNTCEKLTAWLLGKAQEHERRHHVSTTKNSEIH